MKISYKKLWHILVEREMTKSALRTVSGISTATMSKLNKGQNVNTDVLLKICKSLGVGLHDIMDTVDVERETVE